MGGLQVIDVSNPRSPQRQGRLGLEGYSRAIAVAGEHAFVASSSNLLVVDVSDPLAPRLLGKCGTVDIVYGVVVSEGHVYLAESSSGLRVIDVSIHASPRVSGAIGTRGSAWAVAVSGNRVFVAAGSGLQIAPAQCEGPAAVAPQSFSALPLGTTVQISWRLREFSDPADFRLRARIETMEWDVPHRTVGPGEFIAMDYSARLALGGTVTYCLYSRQDGNDWALLREERVLLPELSRVTLLAPRPNPFNPHSVIPFVLPRRGNVRLAILRPDGRLVTSLISEPLGPGPAAVTWDGTDRSGRPAPSGVYMARLEAGGEVVSCKLVLAR